jgi:ATP-dependent helicase/nuclease subunit A
MFDADARRIAVDPTHNVVLEASAGTGKTRVLVERYVNLLLAGVDPEQILAITFTRKAAAEMRQRIIERLREGMKDASRTSPQLSAAKWRELRERMGDIAISTIDAFCLSLIREFPLEAGVAPGFDLADQTQIPRLISEALDRSLRIGRHLAQTDPDVAMVFVQLRERRLRQGLGALLDRRLVAADVLRRFLQSGPRELTPERACLQAASRLADALSSVPGGLDVFLREGPLGHPQFAMLAPDLRDLVSGAPEREGSSPEREGFSRAQQASFRMLIDRIRGYFLTADGSPRKARGFGSSEFKKEHCASEPAWKRHREGVEAIAPAVEQAVRSFRRDLNVILSRGVWQLFRLSLAQYHKTLESYAVLDFAGVLERAVELLRQMEEFSQSRYKLEARYQHVLVDEFQDTNRAQWELVSLLVRSWGEGFGVAAGALAPSIFVVGDRKQSIYGFRDAEVAVLDEAGAFVAALRPEGEPRQAISTSFRAVPELQMFANDLFAEIAKSTDAQRRDAFRYAESDRFPVEVRLKPNTTDAAVADSGVGDSGAGDSGSVRLQADQNAVTFIGAPTVEDAADRVGEEIDRLLKSETVVRDPRTGVARAARPADIAIMFRSRDSHRDYETALDRRNIPTYVYKGLGFFEADEVQDAIALLRFLARPTSNLRAVSLLRSRLVRLSDAGVALLAPQYADALGAVGNVTVPLAVSQLDAEDREVLDAVRASMPRWLAMVDRVTPSELLDAILRETAYGYEMRGARFLQARENLKKLRALVRKAENRGYATLARIAEFLDDLAVGDESNAVIDALDAVNLMTVHAAKGLEFPVVFVVNMNRGTGGPRAPIRVMVDGYDTPSVSIGDFDSDADEDATAREREETKRLLYVAVTRARDRLYLGGVVKDGTFKPGRGSLGEVLPLRFRPLFGASLGVGLRAADNED